MRFTVDYNLLLMEYWSLKRKIPTVYFDKKSHEHVGSKNDSVHSKCDIVNERSGGVK